MADDPIRRWYKVSTLDGTKWNWYVICDPYNQQGGVEDTKKEAKRAANGYVCSVGGGGTTTGEGAGDGNSWTYVGENGQTYTVVLEPPKVNASMVNGHLEWIEMINPWTNDFYRFTLDDISGNELAWLAGLCFYDKHLSQKHELVAAMLKYFHIYLGGNSKDEIKSQHNLSEELFEKIASKSWDDIIVAKTIGDNGTIHLDWDIES